MAYNGLTRLDGQLAAQPELAETISNEPAPRPGPSSCAAASPSMTARPSPPADVIYTLNRIKDPKSGSIARALAVQMTDIAADGPDGVKMTLVRPERRLARHPRHHPFHASSRTAPRISPRATARGPSSSRNSAPASAPSPPATRITGSPASPISTRWNSSASRTSPPASTPCSPVTLTSPPSSACASPSASNPAPGYGIFETASGNYNDFIMRQNEDPTKQQGPHAWPSNTSSTATRCRPPWVARWPTTSRSPPANRYYDASQKIRPLRRGQGEVPLPEIRPRQHSAPPSTPWRATP